jgi:hypothetical protein
LICVKLADNVIHLGDGGHSEPYSSSLLLAS